MTPEDGKTNQGYDLTWVSLRPKMDYFPKTMLIAGYQRRRTVRFHERAPSSSTRHRKEIPKFN